METCDISLVKQEIVELIKTEPQNEDGFDTCGKSGIKTEDSDLVGDFKDTKNYETHSFQTTDVEMKSPWDGFLPIKEQIKDESDTSDFVDEIVKAEIKLYDSSLGVLNSNRDHFTPVDKSEIKLEQDQSTLSSEILQSNIFAQTSSDFNLSIKCDNENKYLSFNALHMNQECRNPLPKRLCYELKENFTTEYKSYFLNSDQSKYGKEHKGVFNENKYKTLAGSYSYNNLTGDEFKDNVEINISIKHPKIGGVCVSTEATETNCKFENHTKIREHCIAPRIRKKCKIDNCTKKAQKGGHCIAHGGGRKCKTENCSKFALKGGICLAHGGGRKCKNEYCDNKAKLRGYCIAHGGRRICRTDNCTKYAQFRGFCILHGGGRKCKTENCTKNALIRGHCRAHGGGCKCKTINCVNIAQVGGNCIVHGGGRKCKTENCTKYAQVGGYCRAHGGGSKCKTENCTKNAEVGGHCIAHGGGKKCKTTYCTKYSQVGGHCRAHGVGRKCKTDNITKKSEVGGHCIAHGRRRK